MTAQILSHVDMHAELSRCIQADLQRVEQLLHAELSKGEDFLTEKSKHLLLAGGKRFRPVFTLLCGYLGAQPHGEDLITAAAIIELVHLATLYHDDVMDEASMRRGVPSANYRWSNTVAILVGDNLFARAIFLLADLGTHASTFIANTVTQLVTGQLRETIGADAGNEVAHYLQVIEEKTACLIAAGGELAGITTKAPQAQIAIQNELGRYIGMAFQISDDIIDISSAETQSGKARGTDLREGVLTLPVLYALEEKSAASKQLAEIIAEPVKEEEHIDQALSLIAQTKGIECARADLKKYIKKGEQLIDQLPPGLAQDALHQLNASTLVRVG